MLNLNLAIAVVFAALGALLIYAAIRMLATLHHLRERNARVMYSLCHDELSNPLQSALAALGNIEHRKSFCCARQQQDIRSLRNSLDRMVDVMRNLKSWMLLESPDVERVPSQFNLVALVQSIIVDLGPVAEREHVRLEYLGSEHGVYTYGIEEDLRRALMNIVGNGVRYSRDTVDSYVKIELSECTNVIQLVIVDNGTGMSEKQMQSIGEAPQRPDTRHIGTVGTGLGLFLVKKILLANKVRLGVTSSTETGTRFTLEFPLLASKSDFSTQISSCDL